MGGNNIKNKVFFIITLVVVFALAFTVALANRSAYEGEAIANEIGTTINEFVSDLLAEDSEMARSESILFATVLDEEISQSYFNVRVALSQRKKVMRLQKR